MNEVVTLQFSLRISLVQQYMVLRFCKESDQEMSNNTVSLAELANTKNFFVINFQLTKYWRSREHHQWLVKCSITTTLVTLVAVSSFMYMYTLCR